MRLSEDDTAFGNDGYLKAVVLIILNRTGLAGSQMHKRKEASMDGDKLIDRLQQTYGGRPETKQDKSVAARGTFIADDRGKSDMSPHGRPFGSLCELLVRANDTGSVDVCLRGNVPLSEGVKAWVREHEASLITVGGSVLEAHIEPGRESILDDLANQIEAITKTGAPRYPVASWKFAAPRTAACLHRLGQELRECRGGGQPEAPDLKGSAK